MIKKWRETVKLLPCMVITKCPMDRANLTWSKDGISRQQMRCQMIFESREVHSTDDGGIATIDQHHSLSFGRLLPEPACDDVGDWNIADKKVSDGQQKTLRIVQHTVVHLRVPNMFLVAAAYEDNAVYLFEVYHQRGFERIDNAMQTKWDREWCFYGVKLGYFGANVPRHSGLGRVRGRILRIAFDVREWLEPGLRWPVEKYQRGAVNKPERFPCIRVRQPSGLALVVLVDGEAGTGEVLPEADLPSVTMSGGLMPSDPIAEELDGNKKKRKARKVLKSSGRGVKKQHMQARVDIAASENSPESISKLMTPPRMKLSSGSAGLELGAAKPSRVVVKANVQVQTVAPNSKSKIPQFSGKSTVRREVQSTCRQLPPLDNDLSNESALDTHDESSDSDDDSHRVRPNVRFERAICRLPTRTPQRPRFLTHTIHLHQGHNKNIKSGEIGDPRGATWEYVGLPKKDSKVIQVMRKIQKANAKLRALRQADWSEYNQLYVGNGIGGSAWIDEQGTHRQLILQNGGKWPEGVGFERCRGRNSTEGEGLGVRVRVEKVLNAEEIEKERKDAENGSEYDELGIGSMGVAEDIGMGRLMHEEAQVVPPGMGVGAYRQPRDPRLVPEEVYTGMGPLYNKRTYQYFRKETTTELVSKLRPIGQQQAAENMLRDKEMATEQEIVGVLEDLHAPGMQREELGKLISLGGATVGSGYLQLAPERTSLLETQPEFRDVNRVSHSVPRNGGDAQPFVSFPPPPPSTSDTKGKGKGKVNQVPVKTDKGKTKQAVESEWGSSEDDGDEVRPFDRKHWDVQWHKASPPPALPFANAGKEEKGEWQGFVDYNESSGDERAHSHGRRGGGGGGGGGGAFGGGGMFIK